MNKERCLAVVNPELIKEWHPTKNGNLKPEDVTCSTNKKVWWIGECGHEWEACVSSRNKGSGCPYCLGKKVLSGFNDLKTTNPDLASEWHPTKNIGLVDKYGNDISTPDKVRAGANKKAWWLGKCGHEWKAFINNRNRGANCPICNKELFTSFSEQALFYYIKNCFNDAINSDMEAIGTELDIYIPSIHTAIEYDSYIWHKDIKKIDVDKKRNEKCKQAGITLIRIREPKLVAFNDCVCFYRDDYNSSNSLDKVIYEVLSYIDKNIDWDIDTVRDSAVIHSKYLKIPKKNSVADSKYISEWNYDKNGNLNPKLISADSNMVFWWKCNTCGYEWQSSPNTRKIAGCSVCGHGTVKVGYNDLATKNPELAKEWNHNKNGDLKPEDVTYNSRKKVWWKCRLGHEWETTVCERNRGSNCPYCSNHKVLKGFNDLLTTNPEKAKYWDYVKNVDIKPTDLTSGSSRQKIYWKCPDCGYEWSIAPANMKGCKMCYISKRVDKRSKPVLCIETNTRYDSICDAAKKLNVKTGTILYRCNHPDRVYNGCHWKYVE